MKYIYKCDSMRDKKGRSEMEFQVLKKDNLKRNIIIGVFVVLIISAVVLNFTRAKYRSTASVPIVDSEVNYVRPDLNIVAIVVDGVSTNTMPEGNYKLLDTSYCTVNGEDANVTLEWDQTTQMLTVTPFTTRGTKCYLYFETATTKIVDTVLGEIEVNLDTPDFSKTSCSAGSNNGGNCGEETVGIYEETTSKGTTYYWRGDVENNYLVFANKYWRIIRINEDGSIRIIYSGEKSEVDAAGKEAVLANGYNDSSTDYTQIGIRVFNASPKRSEYVGYRYTSESQRPNSTNEGTDSTIKTYLENWYSNNLQSYDSRIVSSASAGFCNDRNLRSTEGEWVSTGSTQYYAAYERRSNGIPTYECSNSNDLYQTKIGLITADEVMYAGGKESTTNYGYYLYTRNNYWTMSPSHFNGSTAYVFCVFPAGDLDSSVVSSSYYSSGVRPVINLSTNNTITGNGTINDPFVVV